VLIKRALRGCAALTRWTMPYLCQQSGERSVDLKEWGSSGIRTIKQPLSGYIGNLEHYESELRTGSPMDQRPPYLHDVPLTSILPNAISDLETFPAEYFPAWYRREWPKFAQLFLGPSHSVTPLHFDCLLTHNLFFQINGLKKFIVVARDRLECCYPRDWRWCNVDAGQPDYDKYPLYKLANPIEIIVEPGDVLYLPPGTLHYVQSLECAVSFNVDWHTKDSALTGSAAFWRGMPLKNVYYNVVISLGLWTGIPAKRLLPFYASYLNYVS
jgi:hypothetical protein